MKLRMAIVNQLARVGSPGGGLARYCFEIWLLAVIPIAIYLTIAGILIDQLGIPTETLLREKSDDPLTPWGAFASVVIAPTVETAILVLLVWLLRRFSGNYARVCICSGFAWGLVHGVLAALWFPVAFWAFFLFTYAYLVRRANSRVEGLLAAWIPHVFQNTTAVAAQFLWQTTQ